MGLMDSIKAFMHSVTTEDHYASYGSPYENSTSGGSANSYGNSSTSRLNEISNSSSHSLVSSRNASSSNIVGYRPGMRSSTTNVNVVGSGSHEMQTFGTEGHPPLPTIDSLWDRIEAFLEEEYPELEDSLNSGASSADLNEFEKDLAIGPLPVEVRQFYKRHDGQFRGGKPTGLLMGLTLLDIESIMEEYSIWAKVAEKVERQVMALQQQQQQAGSAEGSSASQMLRDRASNIYLMHQKSIPADAVQPYYVHRGWMPIARDFFGNLIGLDLAPGPAGQRGQIILYGREFDTKVVIASCLQEFLFQFVSDLDAGNFQIDKTESYNDDGFLDTSRSDDYMIGDEDEDNGELSYVDRDGSEFGKNSKSQKSYIEVLKLRALKRYGVTRVESFQTTFTPQRITKHPGKQSSHRTTSKNGSSTQVNVTSSSDLVKETLIDDSGDTKVLETKDETTQPASETAATERNITEIDTVEAEPKEINAAEKDQAPLADLETKEADDESTKRSTEASVGKDEETIEIAL